MTYRIGWISPLSPRSGIGSFSKAVLDSFPKSIAGDAIDVTAFYVDHAEIYRTSHRAVKIIQDETFQDIFGVFDLLVYNIGNNREHHEPIYELLRLFPGLVICHDYVYQHYLADRCMRASRHFASYAALMRKFSSDGVGSYIRKSQITSRTGRIRYSPWDADICTEQPMSQVFLGLGSALVVHSAFSRRHAERNFEGPILELGMPYDLRPTGDDAERSLADWRWSLAAKPVLDLVSFGHIQSSKCIDLLIEAIGASAELRKRVRYKIAGFVGDHAYYDELRARVQALGLQTVVFFETGLSERRLQELMLETDVFVNLRRPNTEAASLSLIEQLETGRPVVVIAGGCYAEVPDGSALKLPMDVTSNDLAAALEDLLKAPKRMVEMGRLGRRHARTWSTSRYGEALVSFALQHRRLIERRRRAVFRTATQRPANEGDDKWLQSLGRARSSLIYLDRNVLPVDPAVVMSMSHGELCNYVADVILGLFECLPLRRALSRYFARLDRHEAYWACARFALLADAVFNADEAARNRLINGKPCYDPEFWSVVELFPSRHCLTAAALLVAGRLPTADELTQCDRDDHDGFPIRSRLAPLLNASSRSDGDLALLRAWAEQQQLPTSEAELSVAEDTELHVGGSAFGSHVDLSGFHPMEPDRVWTRGARGFIGLRLAAGTTIVELRVSALLASRDQPNEISLGCGDEIVRAEIEDMQEVWLRLVVEVDDESASGNQWLTLATSRAAVPLGSGDPRILGVCLRTLRVAMQRDVVDLDTQRDLAVARLNGAMARMRREDKVAFEPKPAAHG